MKSNDKQEMEYRRTAALKIVIWIVDFFLRGSLLNLFLNVGVNEVLLLGD